MRRGSLFIARTAAWAALALLSMAVFASCLTGGTPATRPVNDTSKFDDIAPGKIAALLSPGWNLGNQLEGVKIVPDAASGTIATIPSETGYCPTRISKELIDAVKASGFKFVRIPVSYFSFIDDRNGYKIDPAWLARIKEVVDMCVAAKLYCMINMHGDGYTTIPNSWLLCAEKDQGPILEKYSAVWRQVAETFKGYDESLLFESMNEEFDGQYNGPNEAAYENINAYNEAFVRAVRSTGGNNARRWLLLAGWNTNIDQTADGFGEKGRFRLPKDDRLMVSLHYYDPWGFCGGENGTATQWGSFASRPDKANGTETSMAKQFNKIRDVFTSRGIPVILGEWGSIDKAEDDPDSATYRAYFAKKVCENSKRVGAVPVIWDNGWNGKYGFALFHRGDKANDKGDIVPGTVKVTQQGIIDAIMGVYAAPAKSASKARISLDSGSLQMEPGDLAILNARVAGSDDVEPVTWSSSDETVAVVWDGVVKAAGSGSCEISAKLANGKAAKSVVTVSLTGGIQARVYCFEGKGWSSVKSEPLVIKTGVEKEYQVRFNASKLVLTNIAALYLKDLEVEENHAAASAIDSCLISVQSISINGLSIPLLNNENIEAVNGKKQFDLPMINEWNPAVEMIGGFPPSGNRDIASAVKGLKLDEEKNEIAIKFRTLPAGGAAAASAKAAPPKPVLDPDKTYHAYFGIQAADSWVFRNSYGNGSYGGNSKEFKNGLFDTENGLSADGHAQGTITDADITKADIEAGKTFAVSCVDFNLADKSAKPAAFNVAMISTDIPFALIKVLDAKLYLDGAPVNVKEGKGIFTVDSDNGFATINFINIWNKSLKTFGYSMPVREIKMEFTCSLN